MYGNTNEDPYNNKIRIVGKISKLCNKRYYFSCRVNLNSACIGPV